MYHYQNDVQNNTLIIILKDVIVWEGGREGLGARCVNMYVICQYFCVSQVRPTDRVVSKNMQLIFPSLTLFTLLISHLIRPCTRGL